MSSDELSARLAEFVKDARSLLARAEEASTAASNRKLQTVADVVSLTDYSLVQLSDERTGILEYLEAEGIRAGTDQ